MAKKRGNVNNIQEGGKDKHHPTNHKHHPIFHEKKTVGQRASDLIASLGGSWRFIIFLFMVLIGWMAVNVWVLVERPFDPYPFILLNLLLSTLAAFQAPIILMAQNRQAERDRIDAKYDHQINRKAERENIIILKDLSKIKSMLNRGKN